jgi:GTP-binding protein
MKPVVAIIGRPNVGKSTLFNRLIGIRKAVVVDEPGVTRDLNYGDVEECGRTFTLVDTGGYEPGSLDIIQKQVREQATYAIEDSDLVLLLFDGRTGPTGEDALLVDMLRKVSKPVVYGINKIDSATSEPDMAEFYSLGIDSPVGFSAEQGRSINELLDAILAHLPDDMDEEENPDEVKVAIVGRPNVGKSSLLNRLTKGKRALVSPIAGTTRDPVDMPFEREGKKYLFIDTAGIRKKMKISHKVEIYSAIAAVRSISRCDLAVLVVDAVDGITMQDEKIAGLIEDNFKCCVVVVNKWDAIEKDTKTMSRAVDMIKEKLSFVSYAPVLFISALTGQRTTQVFDSVDSVIEASRAEFKTSKLNIVLEAATCAHHAPSHRGKMVKFYYMTQTGTAPPTFTIFTNTVEGIRESYRRYLINYFREALELGEVPIKLKFKRRH